MVRGIGTEAGDTLALGLINGFMANLVNNPDNSLLYLLGGPGNCHFGVLEQFPNGTVAVTDSAVESTDVTVLASDCNLQPNYVSTLTLGPLGNGPVTGTASDSPQLPPDQVNIVHGGSITATMAGAILQGSVTWNVHYSTGMAVYTFTFRAVQVVP